MCSRTALTRDHLYIWSRVAKVKCPQLSGDQNPDRRLEYWLLEDLISNVQVVEGSRHANLNQRYAFQAICFGLSIASDQYLMVVYLHHLNRKFRLEYPTHIWQALPGAKAQP